MALSTGRGILSHDDLQEADEGEKESLLDHVSEPDDDELLFNRDQPATSVRSDNKVDGIKIQIREVTEVMRDNVQRVIERGDRLDDLQVASDRLSMAGSEFRDSARKAQRRAWMQNFKSRMILISVTVLVVLFIIVSIFHKSS